MFEFYMDLKNKMLNAKNHEELRDLNRLRRAAIIEEKISLVMHYELLKVYEKMDKQLLKGLENV